MLGGQGELEERIKQASTLHETAKTLYQEQREANSEFEDASLVTAPAYYICKMRTALQCDTHRADRERIISKTGRQCNGYK